MSREHPNEVSPLSDDDDGIETKAGQTMASPSSSSIQKSLLYRALDLVESVEYQTKSNSEKVMPKKVLVS